MLFAIQQQQIKKILPSTFCHHWRVLKECEDRWWMSLNDLHCMLCVCVKESTLEPLHGPYICLCGIAIDLLPHAVKLPCTCHHTKGWICLHFRWTLQYLTRWIANWKHKWCQYILFAFSLSEGFASSCQRSSCICEHCGSLLWAQAA